MKSITTIILVAIGGTIAVETNKYLLDKDINVALALLLSSILTVFFFTVFTWLLTDLPIKFRLTRRFLDSRSKYEGYYIETFLHLSDRPHSIGYIKYNPDTEAYDYGGRAYDAEGNLKATWLANSIHIDCGSGEVRHFFSGHLIGKEPESIRGYGIIQFGNGEGFFIDSGSGLAEWHFNISKLTKRDLEVLIGKRMMPQKEDWYQIILAYEEQKRDI